MLDWFITILYYQLECLLQISRKHRNILLDDKKMAKHGQEIYPKAKFIAESYLSATFNPNISDFFDLPYSRE